MLTRHYLPGEPRRLRGTRARQHLHLLSRLEASLHSEHHRSHDLLLRYLLVAILK